MPTNLPDQNWTVPAGADLADNPFAFTDFAADVLRTVVLRYPNTATRNAFNGSRVAGDISFVTGRSWYDRWNGATWVPVTPIQAFKMADQTVNNTVTLVNDTELSVPLPTDNIRYLYRCGVRYNSNTIADIKLAFALPAGAVATIYGPGIDLATASPTALSNFADVVTPGTFASGGTGSNVAITLNGGIQVAGTTGNFTLQFAQNTLNASNTSVLAFSFLQVWGVN